MDYHVIAIVPAETCDIKSVMSKLAEKGYKAQAVERGELKGFRVEEEDGWGIVALIEDDEEVKELIQAIMDEPPAGITAQQREACQLTLSIWSDDDSDFMNAHVFEEFIQCLKESFGYFIYDNRLGEWR